MKIAVASQNRKTVTAHAGKCRKFWLKVLVKGFRLELFFPPPACLFVAN